MGANFIFSANEEEVVEAILTGFDGKMVVQPEFALLKKADLKPLPLKVNKDLALLVLSQRLPEFEQARIDGIMFGLRKMLL